jgi:hypothetical protein
MSRDRKLLCLVIAAALLSEAMMFTVIYLNADVPSRAEALEEARECNERLVRAYGACFARGYRQNKGRRPLRWEL